MGIEEIVKVDIVRGTKTITKAGFGTAIIFSSEAIFSDVRTYKSLKAVEADFNSATATWKFANKLFGQERKPKQIKIAKRTAKAAQVITLSINENGDGSYIATIDGVDYTFVAAGSTVAQIRTGLVAAINADTAIHGVVATNGVPATDITLTAQVAGSGFGIGTSSQISFVNSVLNNGVQEDLSAAEALDNDFYAILLTSRSIDDVKNAAAWVETRRKIFVTASNDASILNNTGGNIAAFLKAKGYVRTILMYSGDQAIGPDAAYLGRCLPLDPGSETWKFKDLVGIAPDIISDTQLNNLKLNNVNNYRSFAGFSMTSEGVVAGGEFIDVIRFIDWLQAQIEENIFALLISVPKVAFTDVGLASIENVLRAQLQRGVNVGGLKNDPSYEVFVPKVADIPVLDRATRTVPGITFNAQLAGAVHFVEISGTVTV